MVGFVLVRRIELGLTKIRGGLRIEKIENNFKIDGMRCEISSFVVSECKKRSNLNFEKQIRPRQSLDLRSLPRRPRVASIQRRRNLL